MKEDDFYTGLREGLSTRGLPRGVGNCWHRKDPDGRTRKGRGFWEGVRWARDEQRTHTALLLLGDTAATPELIATWTDEQCAMAEYWAMHEHLSASDNPTITRFPRPDFVPHQVAP